jgi:hypothetical protein
LLRLSWLLGLIACLILVPGAQSIGIHISGSSGSVSLSSIHNFDINVPLNEVIPVSIGWMPIYSSGSSDINYGNIKPFKSATGVFDCTCFKAATQAQFPRVYH